MLWLYNLLFPLVFLFFIPGIIIKLIRRPGQKQTFAERFAIFSGEKKKQLRASRGAVWIHAVSVGETMVALSLLKQWQEMHPQRKFVLSTTTTTGQALAMEKAPANVVVFFAPLDLFFMVRRVFSLLQPSMLVILETEIWPEMISEARRRGTKLVLVNARMSDKSSRGYYRFRLFFRPLLELFDLICVQTELDCGRYAKVAPHAQLTVCGNMKFDQPIPDKLPDLNLGQYFGEQPYLVLLAASTHPGEEELIARVWLKLRSQTPKVKLVIIPRHAERGQEISGILNKLGINFARRTQTSNPSPVDCLLADTTGEMLAFIKHADAVIMGKSLAGHDEGHNLIEPALLAKPIITGTVLKNFRFVMDTLTQNQALIAVADAEQLETALNNLFTNPEQRQTLGAKAFAAITQHRGAVSQTINSLEKLL
jgi:3-deoxy-D-manno-octulosonic-acid transferase